MKNYGLLLEEELNPKHWRFGGYTGIVDDIIVDNWGNYLPDREDQRKLIDTMGCVSFSANNVLETIINHRIVEDIISHEDYVWLEENGYIIDGIVNFSDRYLAKMSNTGIEGNYFHIVGDTLRKYGCIPESLYPFNSDFSWDEYYSEVPEELIILGGEFAKRFPISYEFLQNKDIPEAIKYAPLQVGVYAWSINSDGKYILPSGKRANHAVEGVETFTIFDTYNPYIKDMVENYPYGAVLKYHVEFNKKDKVMDIKNNTLVMDATGSGAFGLVLDGKIIVDDPALVHLTWIMRNSVLVDGVMTFQGGRTLSLTKKQWDSFQKINLKKENI